MPSDANKIKNTIFKSAVVKFYRRTSLNTLKQRQWNESAQFQQFSIISENTLMETRQIWKKKNFLDKTF